MVISCSSDNRDPKEQPQREATTTLPAKEEANVPVRISVNSQPLFRPHTLESAGEAIGNIGPSETVDLEFDVPANAGQILITLNLNVRSGFVAFDTKEGRFVFLPNQHLQLITRESTTNLRFRERPHLLLRILFPEDYTPGTHLRYEPVVLFVNNVEDLLGQSVSSDLISHELPYDVQQGRATIYMKVYTSDDFSGDIGEWEQPPIK
jgi:hypothetical protein